MQNVMAMWQLRAVSLHVNRQSARLASAVVRHEASPGAHNASPAAISRHASTSFRSAVAQAASQVRTV